MAINLSVPKTVTELKPRITVVGVGGAGGNAVNNMIRSQLEGVEFVIANTDSQAIAQSLTERRVQLGIATTAGLGAGSRPEVGKAAAEECLEDILEHLRGSNMVFITAGMGGGTGTGAAPVIARLARENGILTVGVVTKPFQFEGAHRMKLAEAGIEQLQQFVDTLIIIPNQNLFRIANERTTFADAFKLADNVLYSGVRGVTDLMVMPGLINLDFADIRTVMSEMGKAMMGTGEAEGEKRAIDAAEAAISNPLLEDASMKGARGVLINITGGPDMTLFEVDEAANRIRDEVDSEANIIFGSTFDPSLEGRMRVSVVATGIDSEANVMPRPTMLSLVGDKPNANGGSGMSHTTPTMPKPAPRQETMFDAPAQPPAQNSAQAFQQTPPQQQQAEPAQNFAPEPAPAPVQAPAPTAQARLNPGERPFIAPAPVQASQNSQSREPEQQMPPVVDPNAQTDQSMRHRAMNLLKGIGGGKPRPTPAPAPAPHQSRASQPQQGGKLGGADQADRTVPAHEEDLLDIPAFLRRQAN